MNSLARAGSTGFRMSPRLMLVATVTPSTLCMGRSISRPCQKTTDRFFSGRQQLASSLIVDLTILDKYSAKTCRITPKYGASEAREGEAGLSLNAAVIDPAGRGETGHSARLGACGRRHRRGRRPRTTTTDAGRLTVLERETRHRFRRRVGGRHEYRPAAERQLARDSACRL